LEIELNLLIHADPGARSGFVAAWLTGKLSSVVFDVGAELQPNFIKIHNLNNDNQLKKFNGIKVRIKPQLDSIDLLSLLFLRKNVYTLIPNFTRDEYSLETLTKLVEFSKEIFQWDAELNYSLYDHTINFNDTFNTERMIDLYKQINYQFPAEELVDILIKTNKLNNISIDKNHACSILKLTFLKELQLGLKEEHRFWSIVDIYNNTPVDKLYNKISESIDIKNYGILL
jgi:hypothetical protein